PTYKNPTPGEQGASFTPLLSAKHTNPEKYRHPMSTTIPFPLPSTREDGNNMLG
ncbi:hypothetical protein A2U01_0069263, partial [Trifolium medium]|nr:hypothetical protein [Trifolium medium]